jgi:hypothetical protein
MAQNKAELKTEGRQPLKATLHEGHIDEDLIRKFVRASKDDLIEYQLRDEDDWTALDFRGGDTRGKFEAGAVLTLRLVKGGMHGASWWCWVVVPRDLPLPRPFISWHM